MVLLTYKSRGAVPGSFSSNGAGPSSLENDEGKHEGPKTAYLDQLCKFEAYNAYASEERCDLFFICQGGDQVPAHRLVISNVSKYIMAMQDDQPPWYPVYISVPDLPKQMVQTLVKLAYTGKMTLPPDGRDELFDAMQTLGWVHTDCLTASYPDSAGAHNDDDVGNAVSSKTAESLETVLKMKFPLASKEKKKADSSDDDDDDDDMEMDVPDVPLSDEDEVTSNNLEKTPKKKGPANSNTGRRSARKSLAVSSTAVNNNTTPAKNKVANKVSGSPKATRRNASPAVEKNKKQDPKGGTSVTPAESEPGRRGRKNNTVEASPAPSNSKERSKSPPVIEEVDLESTNQEPEPEAVRSRTRTIRKPKKFDDAIVLTPTKRKESTAKPATTPTKSPPKVTNSKQTEEPEKSKKVSNAVSTKKTNATESTTANDKPQSKSRGSTSSEKEKTPLITSFFTKQNSRGNCEDMSSIVESVRKVAANVVQDGQNPSASSRSRKSSRFEEKSDAAKDDDDVIEIIEEKKTDKKEKEGEAGTSTSALRKRVKSTASTKSDKDAGPNEAVASTTNTNHDESSKTGTLRRKRNLQESEEPEPESETNNGVPVPTTRGRKPSTISNASKSSKASNKAADSTVDGDGDLDGLESGPRRKRSRQE